MLDDIPRVSGLFWLDFSEHERRKALDVIDMFRDNGTVDELGLGTIRDAVSNILFPGTSTIQTRARYFLFIPWIYRELESRESAVPDAARLARRLEMRLIDALIEGGESDGVIGIDAREGLKRLPSSVYWQGLRLWGIREAEITLAEYHRNFRRYGRVRAARDDEALGTSGPRDVWHANLPDPPDKLLTTTTFKLRRSESEYLRERLMLKVSHSLLAWLVDSARPSEVEYPWLHPDRASFPEPIAFVLEHARKFSLAFHGAALAYNLYLSELVHNEELVGKYERQIAEWAEEVEANRSVLHLWQPAEFWSLIRRENPRIGAPTWAFVERWLARLRSMTAGLAMIRAPEIRQLIEHREIALKRKLARLVNDAPRSRWRGDSGSGRMDYRWYRTQIIVNDIIEGQGDA